MVQNAGTGIVHLAWDGQSAGVDLAPGQMLDTQGQVTGLKATLLTPRATYSLVTNGGFDRVDAAQGVTSIRLTVNTNQMLGGGFVGSGGVGDIVLPGGDATYGPSVADLYSRGNLGSVTGAGDVYSRAGVLAFQNLTGSIMNLDQIGQINASGWLGDDAGDQVLVDHGIGGLNAFGIGANVETDRLYDESDVSSNVTIGTGGIQQTVTLGNVASFTGAGNANQLIVESLRGDLNLTGPVVVQLLQIGNAQNAGMDAALATIHRLQMLPSYRVFNNVHTWIRPVTLGNVNEFIAGREPNPLRPNDPPLYVTLDFKRTLRLNNIGTFKVVGWIQADNIYINQVTTVNVTGMPVGRAGDRGFAINVLGWFTVERWNFQNMGSDYFHAGRSVAITTLLVRNGDLPEFLVRGDTAGTPCDFTGSIRVLNGDIQDIDVRNTIRESPESSFPEMIFASGRIERISARNVGTGLANSSLITARTIGSVTARRLQGDTVLMLPSIAIFSRIRATNGDIDLIDATGGGYYGALETPQGQVRMRTGEDRR